MALLRFGRVSSVNASRHTGQVEFTEGEPEGGSMVSWDLPVLASRAGDYALPAAGDQVACLLDDGPGGIGVILGVVYSDADAPPLSDAGQRSIASDDLRLGDPEADTAVGLDGDESDCGMILFIPNVPPAGAASISYIPPPGPYPPPVPPIIQLALKGQLAAGALKVTAA